MNKSIVAIAAIAIATAFLGYKLIEARKGAEELGRRLALAEAQVSALGEELAKTSNALAMSKGSRSLSSDQMRELLKLRGEVGGLRRQLGAAARGAKDSPGANPEPDAGGGELQVEMTQVDNKLRIQSQSRLRNQQTLVLGNWKGVQGRRNLILLKPTLPGGDANAPQTIGFQATLVELEESAMAGVGLAGLADESKASRLESTAGESLMNSLRGSQNSSILASPSLSMASGSTGSIAVGTSPENTLNIKLTPTLSSDGQSVDLQFEAEIPRPASGQ